MNKITGITIILGILIFFSAVVIGEKTDANKEIEFAKSGLQQCDQGFGNPVIWSKECKEVK